MDMDSCLLCCAALLPFLFIVGANAQQSGIRMVWGVLLGVFLGFFAGSDSLVSNGKGEPLEW